MSDFAMSDSMSDIEDTIVLEDTIPMHDDPLAGQELDRAISLRWSLRDIFANRTKFLPLEESDLRELVDMGLVELHDGEPTLTEAGLTAIE